MKGSNPAPVNFTDFRGVIYFCNEIQNGNITIEKIEEYWKQFKTKLNQITTGYLKHKSKV